MANPPAGGKRPDPLASLPPNLTVDAGRSSQKWSVGGPRETSSRVGGTSEAEHERSESRRSGIGTRRAQRPYAAGARRLRGGARGSSHRGLRALRYRGGGAPRRAHRRDDGARLRRGDRPRCAAGADPRCHRSDHLGPLADAVETVCIEDDEICAIGQRRGEDGLPMAVPDLVCQPEAARAPSLFGRARRRPRSRRRRRGRPRPESASASVAGSSSKGEARARNRP